MSDYLLNPLEQKSTMSKLDYLLIYNSILRYIPINNERRILKWKKLLKLHAYV